MERGWIKLYRKLQDNPLWKSEPFTRGQAWVDLLLIANHKEGVVWKRGNCIKIARGQVGWSMKGLADRWQWSRNKVDTFLKWLESEQQIKQQKTKLTTLITIIKFEEYNTKGEQTEQQKGNRRGTEGEQKGTNKKDKKVKKVKKKDIGLSEIDLEGFNIFWSAYPKKKSKGQAREVWGKIKPVEQLLDAILSTIEKAKTSDDWKKDNGKWIPYPATWLNAEGWEDEYEGEGNGKADLADQDWTDGLDANGNII